MTSVLLLTLQGQRVSANPIVADGEPESYAEDRIYQEDGSYIIRDPESLAVGALEHDGDITWEYVGPQVFPANDIGLESLEPRWVPEEVPSINDAAEMISRTRKVDAFGRQWAVISSTIPDSNDNEGEGAEEEPRIEEVDAGGAWETFFAWGRYDCQPHGSPNGIDDSFYSDESENRFRIDTPVGRQKKAVIIWTHNTVGGGQCSGVLVDRKWVITAAHCLSGSSSPVVTFVPQAVCPLGNNDPYYITEACQAADSVILSPDWAGTTTGDMQHDYALIELINVDMGDEYGWMPISTADESVIEDFPSRSLGYPQSVGNGMGDPCAIDNTNTDNVAQDLNVDVAAYLYGGTASVTGWTAGRIKTDHDMSGGNSGGPLYYCPSGVNGACGSGDQEYLVGLGTGHINGALSSYNGGPKHDQFGDWARVILPNQ